MSFKEKLSTPPSSAELKSFSRTVGGAFLVFGFLSLGIAAFKGHDRSVLTDILFGLGVFLLVMGAIPVTRESALMRLMYRGWMKLADLLARYVGHYVGMAIFALIYWLMFTPFSLVSRIVGFDPLGLRGHRRVDSYWRQREGALSSDHYEKQYAKMEATTDES